MFAFDVDKTLANQHDGSTLNNLTEVYPDKYETIENMRRVIESENYVWIVTANKEYNYITFSREYFGESNSDIYKSPFFKFMNPKIMERVYVDAKKLKPLDPTLGDITDWSDKTIHRDGLKPYAMYAQSLLYKNGDFFKDKKFSIVKMYLFDDVSEKEIKYNSKKFGINFIQVTDFNTPSQPNLLKDFTKVLNDGTSKIGSAEKPVIPIEYDDKVIALLMAKNTDLPKCKPDKYIDKGDNPPPNNMIGEITGGEIGNNLQVCVNSMVGDRFLTDTDITTWQETDNKFFSDHAPIKYKYVVSDKDNKVTCHDYDTANLTEDSSNISFVTWNIAYQMEYEAIPDPKTGADTGGYLKSKFRCSESDLKKCFEKDEIYKKRLQNILNIINDAMININDFTYNNYVFLQECTPKTLLEVVSEFVKKFPKFNDDLYTLTKGKSEFCLIVRKSAIPNPGDIIFFDFNENMGDSAMSKYISQQFYSYDIEVNTNDLKRVMCYIVKPASTIFFNVHFRLGKSFIFKRQIELYNFMNAIVYSIRSIPIDDKNLGEYQNYDIVFTGDFNLNMLQRFPQDIKRFGYPGNNNMIPIFFTCNYIPGQRTIISTTPNNKSSARATNGLDSNYNLTNIDFSIFYPRIGDAGTKPIKVEPQTPMPKKQTMPVSPPVVPASSSSSSSTPATTLKLKVMSFNTWYKPFSAQKIKDDGNPQEPDMQYCNIKSADGTLINVCQENIMNEIMAKIDNGFQVIFLQEFTSRITEVFDKDKCNFSDEYVSNKKQIPFTMTYTPPGGKVTPLEYYVYSVTAQGETIVTLCSKSFFKNPATRYYMGNLTGYPNNPSYASDGDTIQGFWEISGGGRPYIVLVFDDEQMILINIHGPHGGTFNPYLQKVSKNPSGKGDFTTIGEKDYTGPYEYEGTKYKYNSGFGYPIPQAVQTEIDKKIKYVEELNAKYLNPTLQDYTFRQLGDMLRKRIPNQLKTYKIIFAGDFNMRPDEAKRHLVKLSEILSTGNYGEGPFSNSSGVFDKQEQNNITLTIGDTKNISTGTCCVEHKGGSYGSGVYDQIYSNKLKVTKYWTYNGNIEYDKKGGILFSDHLPVYAEIELPAQGGGSYTNKHKTLKNNKPISRKIRKHASTSMPTTRFTKKHYHSKHSHNHNKKHKTRRHKN